MKKKNILLNSFAALLLMIVPTSCDSFLDKMPDNRAEVDSETKIEELLVSAYPSNDYMLFTELMSDNCDDYGENNPNTSRFYDQCYAWDDVTESNNESPENVWGALYSAIAAANQALQGIQDVGGATTTALKECKGEALMARAYAHFMLVNIFCLNYNSSTSSKDLGVPYMTAPETTLNPKYERGTVAEDYEKIAADIEEGLPLVGDSYYTVPKYHFNKKAAYAFASRFYLYYEKWQKAADYATRCLGSNPSTVLRDWQNVSKMTQTFTAIGQHYVSADLNCNLLLMTAYSVMGLVEGPYYTASKYAHGSYLASTEDCSAANIWGTNGYWSNPKVYKGTNLDKTIFWKLPYMFEYTDAVAGIGYNRTVYPALTTDECLLNRAEAYIMLKKYDEAAADLTSWEKNIIKAGVNLTPESITTFYKEINYSEPLQSTIKKRLNPAFAIDAEGSEQECMLQCVLGFRRIETLGCGLRWFDVKRYGIEIVRRVMSAAGVPDHQTDVLKKDDPRRAIQLPQKVLDAGMTPNPRS
jgi:hypothetical protein